MDSSQTDPLPPTPEEAAADAAPAQDADDPGAGAALIDRDAIEVIPIDPYAFELDIEQLEAHEAIRVNGRPLAELSDAELALLEQEGEAPDAVPAPPARRKGPASIALGDLNIVWPEKHEQVHLRVDQVVMEWFRRGGEVPGPKMSAVLRGYVDAQLALEEQG